MKGLPSSFGGYAVALFEGDKIYDSEGLYGGDASRNHSMLTHLFIDAVKILTVVSLNVPLSRYYKMPISMPAASMSPSSLHCVLTALCPPYLLWVPELFKWVSVAIRSIDRTAQNRRHLHK